MVTKRHFGVTKNGEAVYAYMIENDRGISVTVLDYGATLQSVLLPHKGNRVDVVLGYDTIGAYENNDAYLGASIGRCAGRIPDSVLRIGTDVFPLSKNEGNNHLHGGFSGFDKRVWSAEIIGDSVRFTLRSPDGEEGYPGTLLCSAAFTLSETTLSIRYCGESDRKTGWNPTNHAYWNLNGHDAGDARGHFLELPASRYLPVGGDMLPTGGEADVTGTDFDFRTLRMIGGCFDHSFVLSPGPIRLFGAFGIGMEIETNCRAVQLYTSNFLTPRTGKGGVSYGLYGAVCLETEGRQAMPDQPIAAENVLQPGKAPTPRETKYRFIIKED